MKKLLFLVLFISAALTLSAEDVSSIMYWMVDSSKDDIAFSYAQLVAGTVDGSGKFVQVSRSDELEIYPDGVGRGIAAIAADEGGHTVSETASALNNGELYNYALNAYSFAIELLNEDYGRVGISEAVAYSDLTGYIQTVSGAKTGVWTVTSFVSAVPEPTSGLLTLCGLALLALRRKRV